MRINGFEQIKQFYSWVFENQGKGVKSHHISLYMFLWNQNNRCNWVEWFKCPYDTGMTGSGINSKHTYYKVLKELAEWGLIEYKPGKNEHSSPLFSLVPLEVQKCTSSVPLPTPLPEPLVIPLLAPLQGRVIKQLTDNIQPITDNMDSILSFLERKSIGKSLIGDSSLKLDEKDLERIKLGTIKIADFFNISEVNQPNHWMKIRKFIEFQARKENGLEYLSEQFTAYKQLKTSNGFKHTWKNWIGDLSDHPEPYCEGAWNRENWKQLLEDTIQSEKQTNGQVLSYSLKNPISIPAPKKPRNPD